jgi:hypothetical protein
VIGGESRPLCVKRYRLDRAAALVVAGIDVVVAAVLVAPAFWLHDASGAAGVIGQICAVVAGAAAGVALWFLIRPPVVLRVDSEGYHSRINFSPGRFSGTWADVENAEVANGMLVLTTAEGQRAFPLRLVGGERVQVLTELNALLDAAHGYRRLG